MATDSLYNMAIVSFLLYNSASNKPTPIIASVTFDGQRHKVYAGISILPKYWNKASQQALTRGYSQTNNSKINDALESTSRPVSAQAFSDLGHRQRLSGGG